MRLTLFALVMAAVLYGIHRLAIWAERRGWIYYQKKSGSASLSSAALEVQSLFEPSKRYVLEEMAREPDANEDSGDPPDAGRAEPFQEAARRMRP
jgi:hypothetical protein